MTQPPAYAPAPGPARKVNTLAIAALVLGLLIPIGGIITGHIALVQINRTGEGGRGLALTGTILGYLLTITVFLAVMVTAIFIFSLGTPENAYNPQDAPMPAPCCE